MDGAQKRIGHLEEGASREMNYIIFDLEWNQSSRKEREEPHLPFEIVEIGAVKLNEKREVVDTFERRVRPQVYLSMHRITGELIGLKMEELQKEALFPEVAKDFLGWCGKDVLFGSWGPHDLPELQRNMDYFGMEPIAKGPLAYLDVQKLYALFTGSSTKQRKSLSHAILEMHFDQERPFHHALSDAAYTAEIFRLIPEELLQNFSFDNHVTPRGKQQEIHIVFDTYAKYISRSFATKEALMKDPEVISTKCYICHRNLRRRIRWFTPNGKHYYALSECGIHGFMKSKIRVKKATDGYFAEKTSKFITGEEAEQLREKQKHGKRK